jgi:hypothetical protein
LVTKTTYEYSHQLLLLLSLLLLLAPKKKIHYITHSLSYRKGRKKIGEKKNKAPYKSPNAKWRTQYNKVGKVGWTRNNYKNKNNSNNNNNNNNT